MLKLRLRWALHIIATLRFDLVLLPLNHVISNITWNRGWWKYCKLLHDLQMKKKTFLLFISKGKYLALKWNLGHTRTYMFFIEEATLTFTPAMACSWTKGSWRAILLPPPRVAEDSLNMPSHHTHPLCKSQSHSWEVIFYQVIFTQMIDELAIETVYENKTRKWRKDISIPFTYSYFFFI